MRPLHELLESEGFTVVKEWNRLYVSTSDGRFLAEIVLEGRRLRVASLERWDEAVKLLRLLRSLVDSGERDEVVVEKLGLRLEPRRLEEEGYQDTGDAYIYHRVAEETEIPLLV